MVMEYNTGQMALTTKVNGSITKLKVKVFFGMQKEIFTMGNFKTIWQMVMVNIHI